MDYVIILCFIVTIIYCWRVDKRVASVRNIKAELLSLVRNFDDSIVRSEICIHELKNISNKANIDLQQRLDSAKQLSQELSFLTDHADEIAEKIELVSNKSSQIMKSLRTTMPRITPKKVDNSIEFEQHSKKLHSINSNHSNNIDQILDRLSEIKQKNEDKNAIKYANDDYSEFKPKIVKQDEYFKGLKRVKI
jgi:methyl-accepting chemotaxis protein